MRRMHRACCLLLSLAVSACSASETTMNTDNPASPAPDAEQTALESRYKRNPNPKQAYQITLTLADAPGPFESVEGFAQYQAPDCRYTVDKLAGVTATPQHNLPISYTKINDTSYVGTVFLDAMLDENYFGDGVCSWEFTSVHARLKASGAHAEAGFVARLIRDQVRMQKPVTTYLQKKFYPEDQEIQDLLVSGQTDREKMKSIGDEDLFIITLTAKEVQQ